MRRALWTDEPYARLSAGTEESVWEQTFVWTGTEGQMMTVSCFTNQPEATLFLNGVSLGTRPAGRDNGFRAVWQVPYQAGTLRAEAGVASDTLATPGPAASVALVPDKTVLSADPRDVAHIELRLLDAAGNLAATDDRVFRVQLLGDADILGLENGKPDDLTPYSEPFRSTHRGRLLIYLRPGRLPGPVLLRVFDRQGLSAQVTLTME